MKSVLVRKKMWIGGIGVQVTFKKKWIPKGFLSHLETTNHAIYSLVFCWKLTVFDDENLPFASETP